MSDLQTFRADEEQTTASILISPSTLVRSDARAEGFLVDLLLLSATMARNSGVVPSALLLSFSGVLLTLPALPYGNKSSKFGVPDGI
jgi:hypothetical protein